MRNDELIYILSSQKIPTLYPNIRTQENSSFNYLKFFFLFYSEVAFPDEDDARLRLSYFLAHTCFPLMEYLVFVPKGAIRGMMEDERQTIRAYNGCLSLDTFSIIISSIKSPKILYKKTTMSRY